MELHYSLQPPPEPDRSDVVAWRIWKWTEQPGPRWVSTDYPDGWTLDMRFDPQAGRPVVSEYRIRPTDPDREPWDTPFALKSIPERGLDATRVRKVRFGPPHTAAMTRFTDPGHPEFYDTEEWVDWVTTSQFDPETVSQPDARPRRGRPSLSDRFLAEIAVRYDKAVQAGHNPVSRIKHEMGEDPHSSTPGQWVSKARKRGFLSAAPAAGQAGGRASKIAYEVLGLTPPTNAEDME